MVGQEDKKPDARTELELLVWFVSVWLCNIVYVSKYPNTSYDSSLSTLLYSTLF